MLSDPDAGRQDPQVLHAVYPQPAGGRDGHLLHQLRRVGADDDPEHHGDLLSTQDKEQTEPERIINVNHVLDELIEQSVALVGKPVALMNKDDKVRAIRFLNESGAFLVTKSGDKVAKYFGISKYTLYSYIDANKDGDK